MHYSGDMTGAEIMRTLRDEARNRVKDIGVLEFSPAVELLVDDKGRCSGAVLYNLETEEYFLVKAKAVVMATGGSGRLHMQRFMTSSFIRMKDINKQPVPMILLLRSETT